MLTTVVLCASCRSLRKSPDTRGGAPAEYTADPPMYDGGARFVSWCSTQRNKKKFNPNRTALSATLYRNKTQELRKEITCHIRIVSCETLR
ncbi:hypothetical protein VTO42DRAFT_3561 [Malbranchea cinnamomea]